MLSFREETPLVVLIIVAPYTLVYHRPCSVSHTVGHLDSKLPSGKDSCRLLNPTPLPAKNNDRSIRGPVLEMLDRDIDCNSI